MLLLFAIVYIYPFLVAISSSFKTDGDATNNPLALIPQTWTVAAYQQLFSGSPLPLWALNSAFITIIVTAARVFFDSLAGYALSRLKFRGRTIVFSALIAVMAVPNVVLLIPRFLILKQFGLYDSYAGMIIPLIVDAGGIFIMKQFFESIPVSVEEAARIDGANRRQVFWQVVWPQLTPVTVFATIWQVIGAIQLFDLVYTTTRGGPLNATQTIVYYLWQTAFQKLDFGYGSAIAYGLFAITLLITIGVVIYSRRSKIEAF